jgi:hypothetical protein
VVPHGKACGQVSPAGCSQPTGRYRLPSPNYGPSKGKGHGPVGTCCNGGGDCSGAPKRWRVPAAKWWNLETSKPYKMRYKLPAGVTAERAVLQWTYQTSNSPEHYPETFWNCADIAIVARQPTAAPVPTMMPSRAPTRAPTPKTSAPAPTTGVPTSTPPPPGSCSCRSANPTTTDLWCEQSACDKVYVEEGFCRLDCASAPARNLRAV